MNETQLFIVVVSYDIQLLKCRKTIMCPSPTYVNKILLWYPTTYMASCIKYISKPVIVDTVREYDCFLFLQKFGFVIEMCRNVV